MERIEDKLKKSNPWWQNGLAPTEDAKSRRSFFAGFESYVLHKKRRAIVLFGPRRSGKTVMLKQLVANCLQFAPPENICYTNIKRRFTREVDLEDIVDTVMERQRFAKDKPSYFIFDEIQFCKDWVLQLKELVDIHVDTEVRFVCSGSAISAKPYEENETGTGRIQEFHLPYMLFYEYLHLQGLWPAWLPQTSAQLLSTPLTAEQIAQLNEHFLDYLTYGVYPEIVLIDNHSQEADAREISREISEMILYRDLPQEYGIKNVSQMEALFSHLYRHNGQEFSLETLCKKYEITKPTISAYIDYFQAAFLVRKVERVTGNFTRPFRVRASKIYLSNPTVYLTFLNKHAREVDSKNMGFLIENAVLSQYENRRFSQKSIFYARWQHRDADYELDFIEADTVLNELQRLLEIKWRNRSERNFASEFRGYANLENQAKARIGEHTTAYALTKADYGRQQINELTVQVLPVAVYCLAIGAENIARTVYPGGTRG